jgi:hypothetical protein
MGGDHKTRWGESTGEETEQTGLLKGDKRAIFSAAANAERAVKFLHGLQPGAQSAGADEPDSDCRARPRPCVRGRRLSGLPSPTRFTHKGLRSYARGGFGDVRAPRSPG